MNIAYHGSILLHYIVLCTTLLHVPVLTVGAKGPHHPGGEFSRKSGKHHLDDHLQHEREHLENDLKRLPIGEQSLTEMSEDEKNFYYFKLHDSDNNDNLDGLEMLHAATHRHSNDDERLHGIDRAGAKPSAYNDVPHLEDEEFNHIIEVIDDFIEFADTDKNGLLNYPEYINAINLNEPKASPTDISSDQPPSVGYHQSDTVDVTSTNISQPE
uniref:EF-hand domain-containing protein n=1 Tax=Anopheles farauti TaxID=69004 RepID=A0A182QWS3_9DIPT